MNLCFVLIASLVQLSVCLNTTGTQTSTPSTPTPKSVSVQTDGAPLVAWLSVLIPAICITVAIVWYLANRQKERIITAATKNERARTAQAILDVTDGTSLKDAFSYLNEDIK